LHRRRVLSTIPPMFARSAIWMWMLAAVAPALADGPATAQTSGGDVFFGRRQPWELHVHLSAEAWQRMQPASRPRFLPRNTGIDRPATLPADERRPIISPMGYIYNTVPGSVQLAQEPPVQAAIRFKGNYSYTLASRGLTRPMKIQLPRSDPARRIDGLRTLNLNTGALDRSMMREPLGFAVFREAGIPAPRTAYARVSLTVDGLHDRRDLGIYVVVEQVDSQFLARHFGNDDGMLLKPEMLRGLPYKGRQWERYVERYNPKSSIDPADGRRFVEFLRLIHFADDQAFARDIGGYLDVEQFLRFIAVQALIVNTDSFLATGHNYYLYQDRRDGRYRFIPWDLNLSFGLFELVADLNQQADLSIRSPHVPPNRLIERMLADQNMREQYGKIITALAEQVYTGPMLRARLAALADSMAGPGASTRPAELRGLAPLEKFLSRRLESVAAQLAGGHAGLVPATWPGLRSRSSWAENHRTSLVQSASMALRAAGLTDEAGGCAPGEVAAKIRKQFDAVFAPAGGAGGGAGSACRLEELADALADILPVPEHFVFDPGPGIDWARIIFAAADVNRDGLLSRDELLAAIAEALRRADVDGDGLIGAGELQRALAGWCGQ
jgi:spore coat protein H